MLVVLVGGEGDDGDGAPVEVVGGHNDLGLVGGDLFDIAPLAGQLEGGLHRLGAGVHGQRHFVAGDVAQFLVKSGSWSLRKAREVSVIFLACATSAAMMRGCRCPWLRAE